ncbi:hypothetical protein AX774_g7426 [Zancudomyces culisetae]|uniref:Uncharacterized protein n=1 Tax=Zancudomyces culisetae TaxID=1213189 RepID=A0A1R1PDU8_ZANCU|nr:hypothetical protein AX774_g7426 [Zancudomyces culisetae]|eukprot:OMH79170.1 hypothetical protein AX774_g7426 [Zancudomyces culisetae]
MYLTNILLTILTIKSVITAFPSDDRDLILELAEYSKIGTDYGLYTTERVVLDAIYELDPYELDSTILGYKLIPFENQDLMEMHPKTLFALKEICDNEYGNVVTTVFWYGKEARVNNSQNGYNCTYPYYLAPKIYNYMTSYFEEKYFISITFCISGDAYLTFHKYLTTEGGDRQKILNKPNIDNCVSLLLSPIRAH